MPKPFSLSRRAFLGAAGTMVALPALEAMLPRNARAGTPAAPPVRFLTFHIPIGVARNQWMPSGTETSWTLGQSQQPLAPYQNDILCITGVSNVGRDAHTAGAAGFLTAVNVQPGQTSAGTSADQYIADYWEQKDKTFIKSLQLGTSILNENPNAEAGYAPVLKDHLSWSHDTPLDKIIQPLTAFNTLFANGTPNQSQQAADKRRAYGKSVLDAVLAQANTLKNRVGKGDQAKLDQYFTAVRQLESQITTTATAACTAGNPPAAGTPDDIRDHVKQMLDLMVLAITCDLTRVVTFGYEHTVTEQTHPFIGVNAGYHIGVTHCGSSALCDTNGTGYQTPYVAVNTWLVSQLAYLIGQLKQFKDIDGTSTLFDNSVVYFSSEFGDGSLHNPDNLPIIVTGGGGGKLKLGRLLDRSGQQNGNVLLALMQVVGLSQNQLGECNGAIQL